MCTWSGAIQKLLHFAVSDVSDDVRRAAVINLGFVLLNVPEQTTRIVSLLVRCAASLYDCVTHHKQSGGHELQALRLKDARACHLWGMLADHGAGVFDTCQFACSRLASAGKGSGSSNAFFKAATQLRLKCAAGELGVDVGSGRILQWVR